VGEVLGIGATTVRRDQAAPDGASHEDEAGEVAPDGAPAERDPAERRAALPPDLVERVDGGMSLDEAESVVRKRAERLAAWAKRVRKAMAVLSGMAGNPVPRGLTERLEPAERKLLRQLLNGVSKEET
jgi:hypothetical protein